MLDLPAIHPADSVAELIGRFREGLRFPCDDSFGDEYSRIRAILRSHPQLKNQLPEFLQSCKTIADYRSYMQQRYLKDFEWDAHSGNALAQLQEFLRSASTLDGYEMGGQLGWGGFGRVYIAQHKLLNRPVAIKFFQPVFHDGGGSALGRFFQEASMLFDLQHPNIITVRDVGMYQERPFIVMDYFDGITLNDALARHGRMPPKKALKMVELLTDAVRHAHIRNIVHRDLKPSNVMLGQKEQCRVIDFGLGVYVEQLLSSRLTRAGETPAGGAYSARELLADPKLVQPSCDIYSIGAIWYTAVTNHVPAGANLADSLTDTDGLPRPHIDIILRALSDVPHRFSTCDELLAAIHDVSAKEQVNERS